MIDNPTDKRLSHRIADYLPLIRATDGLTLSQVCSLSGLEPSTIQNWIKRGYVPHPVEKKYRERHLARILLITELRESMQIDRVGMLLRYVNGDADDESDDIIKEEAMYDLFCDIAQALAEDPVPPDQIGERVSSLLDDTVETADSAKLTTALTVMAYTYMANQYKRGADALFVQNIEKDKPEKGG